MVALKNYINQIILIKKKTFFLINNNLKKRLFLIGLLFIVVSCVEILNISLIIPISSNYLQTQTEQGFNLITYFPDFFLNLPKELQLSYLLIAFVFIFITKNIFSFFLIFFRNKLTFDIQRETSDFLYHSYLKRPYDYFLKINTSIIIRNLQVEIPMYSRLILSIIYIFQDFILVIVILSFLLFVNFNSTLIIMFSLIFISLIYFFIIKKYLKVWSELRIKYDEKKLKNIQQSFSGIKDIKLFNVENMYLNEFSKTNAFSQKFIKYERTLGEFPKIMFEILLIIAFFFIFQYFIRLGLTNTEVIVLLSVYFFSALRIIPSINKLIISFQAIKFCLPSLDAIYKEVSEATKNFHDEGKKFQSEKNFVFKKEIEFNKIKFSYDSFGKNVLDNVNLKIEKNDFIGIFGESGTGKSTFLNIFTGLIKPSFGDILCDNVSIFSDVRSWQANLGYISQNIFLLDDTIKKNISFMLDDDTLSEKDNLYLNSLINSLKLNNFINNLRNGLETKVGELGSRISGGQKQRIGIARALFRRPKILILDEATNALDQDTETEILNEINFLKKKTTIIMISHDKNSLRFCNKIYELKDNQIHLVNEK